MHYFIVNPQSKSGKGEKIWGKLEKLLNNWQIEYECYKTEKAGDAKLFARELTEGVKEPRIIVAVGGDGTVNEILDGLCFVALLPLDMFRQAPAMTWPEAYAFRKIQKSA